LLYQPAFVFSFIVAVAATCSPLPRPGISIISFFVADLSKYYSVSAESITKAPAFLEVIA